ncbi:MAG: hypothetical protein PHI02_07070 [Sulfurovaceae bacterium]|nr:hypothetical protein [Sulfurovaceae bacterium]
MYPRFILPSEKKYNEIFTHGSKIQIYPTQKQWDMIDMMLKTANDDKKQITKEQIKNVMEEDFTFNNIGKGNPGLLIIIKVAEDDS